MRYRYGLRVGYYERGSPIFVCHFKTYTREQAQLALNYFQRYPQQERDTDRLLDAPKWAIKPITRTQYKNGIWDEAPF